MNMIATENSIRWRSLSLKEPLSAAMMFWMGWETLFIRDDRFASFAFFSSLSGLLLSVDSWQAAVPADHYKENGWCRRSHCTPKDLQTELQTGVDCSDLSCKDYRVTVQLLFQMNQEALKWVHFLNVYSLDHQGSPRHQLDGKVWLDVCEP